MGMNINHLNQDKYYEQIGYNHRKKDKGNFEQDFLGKAFENTDTEPAEKSERATQVKFYEYYQGLSTNMAVQENECVFGEIVMECRTENISYAESDNVKVFVAEGFVLKAQVRVDEHFVYIEQKNEDGTVHGYKVDPVNVPADTINPIEQMAVESWKKAINDFGEDSVFTDVENEAQDSDEAKTWEEALAEFYDFVEDRIKNGPPKYRLGSGEWSIEEWEELIDKIDEDIEMVKKELRERIEKQKAEYEEKRRLEQAGIKDSDIDKILQDRDESIL